MTVPPIWVLTTARTSSDALCSMLAAAAGADSYCARTLFEHYNPGYELAPGLTPPYNKTFPEQYRPYHGDLDLSRVVTAYPNVRLIYLYRRDTAAQAVSFLFSKRLDIWNPDRRDLKRLRQYARLVPDWRADDVVRTANWLHEGSMAWHRSLGDRSRLTVATEDLFGGSAERTWERIAAHLGRPGLPRPKPGTVKLENPHKAAAVASAREALRGTPLLRHPPV